MTNGATNSEGRTYIEVISEGFKKDVIIRTEQQCNGGCNENLADAKFELNFINFFKKLDTGFGLFVALETDANGNYIWNFLTN